MKSKIKIFILIILIDFTIPAFSQTNCTNGGFGCSQSCQKNINCPDIPNGYCILKRSVVLILKKNGSAYIPSGTGSLITNSKNDYRPYLVTAAHLLDGNEANWKFVFNYESPNCANIDGSLSQFIIGATVVTKDVLLDYALLELNQVPPGNFNVYYNGFYCSELHPTMGVLIHHPRGDIKKYSRAVEVKNPFGNPDYWLVKDWEDGVGEFGSSGAPFLGDGYLFGIQSAAPNDISCSNDKDVLIRKFYKIWNSFKPYLYPGAPSNLAALGGSEPCKQFYDFDNIQNLESKNYKGYYTVIDYIKAQNLTIKTGTEVIFDAGKSIKLGVGFKVSGGAHFVAKIQGCSNCCNL